jgi:hypothetical protein
MGRPTASNEPGPGSLAASPPRPAGGACACVTPTGPMSTAATSPFHHGGAPRICCSSTHVPVLTPYLGGVEEG